MRAYPTGATRVAGVAGHPIRQSLSPLLHTAWIEAAGLDAAYIPLSVTPGRFPALVEGLRGGAVAGLNVTLPFKEEALRTADRTDEAAEAAGAANLLLFEADGSVRASNTDGAGLLSALAEQTPSWRPDGGPVVVLGAGGAARGAVAALLRAGASVRVVNRTSKRAQALAETLPGSCAVPVERMGQALEDAAAVVNATSAGLEGSGVLALDWDRLAPGAVIMDMVYKPIRTALLQEAAARGHPIVDGLAMLIGQARPSFEAFFGRAPPMDVDVRALALAALGEGEP